MAGNDKPLKLRTVDESEMDSAPAVRLENRETELKVRDPRPVRLGSQDVDSGASWRLDLPDRDAVELRTHQPGIDVLIEPDPATPEPVEEHWGVTTIQRQPIPWGWFALIGILIFGAVLWSLSRVEKADEQAVWIRSSTASTLVDEEQEEREAARLIDRIDKVLRDFANATSVEALARLVRHPERVTPLMRQHYANHPVYCGPLKSIRMLNPVTLGRQGNFWLANVVLGDGEVSSMLVEIGKGGVPRIDWESFVCYQPMAWDEFARKRPAGLSMDFRVQVEIDNFHSHEFADSTQWVCFRLTALDADETLFGYSPAGTPETQGLLSLCELNHGRASLILRLGIPEGLQSRRGVVIEKLINDRWIFVDSPDSEP